METWEQINLEIGQCAMAQAGPMTLWVRRAENEWHVFSRREPCVTRGFSFQRCDNPPENAEWARWAAEIKTGDVRLVPAMPDRPVIVSPDVEVVIPRKCSALFLVGIPPWIRVEVGPEPRLVVFDSPSAMLANTWFGDQMQGTLCYSLRHAPQRSPDRLSAGRAICPVQFTNETDKDLKFEKLCLNTDGLGVYEGEGRLWTDTVELAFREGNRPCDATCAGQAPAMAGTVRKLCEPRNPGKKQIIGQSGLGTFTSILRHSGR